MHLAQLNVAKAKYDMEAEQMKPFVDNLDPVNELAEASEGFIWRLQDESGDATSIQAYDDPRMIVNMSVWASVSNLKDFMFRTHHIDFLKRKKEWFEPLSEDSYVLWWIPKGTTPTVEEAIDRLQHLKENGDSPYAFTFKSNFTADELIAG